MTSFIKLHPRWSRDAWDSRHSHGYFLTGHSSPLPSPPPGYDYVNDTVNVARVSAGLYIFSIFILSLFYFIFVNLVDKSCRTKPAQRRSSYIIIIVFCTSCSHHIRMSWIHLRTGRPVRLSPSTISNTCNDFSSRSSGILQIWPNSWSFLCRMVSIIVQSRCTCRLT